jgi:glycosyltransferase involved in cell wall biosynthesis
MKLSILISMYETKEYIDQCINSLINFCNCFNIEYEIVLGIDGSKKDLEYVLNSDIKDKVELYYNELNQGPFLMYNALIDLCKYDKIFIFDSDDYLNDKCYNELYSGIANNDFVKLGFYNFKNNRINRILFIAQGVFVVSKEILKKYGYFEDWFCAADTEFQKRLKYYNVKEFVVNAPTFFRRVHPKSLTQCNNYGLKSTVRKNYKNKLNDKINNNDWTSLVIVKANVKKYD